MRMLIGGEWIDKDEKIEVSNPYDGSLLDTVPKAGKEDVERAIRSALRGSEVMRELPAYKRSEILGRTADLLQERSEEFSRLLSQEVGKTIREARGEVARAVQTFTIGSEEAKRIQGETVPFDSVQAGENRIGFYLRVPVGVVLAITPFNVPLNLAAHKLAPAFASGNSVILKPATATPLADLKLGEILLQAGLPEEGLNIITGPGELIGDQLVSDSRIRMVTFTGSAEVGKGITRKAGLKKIALELGSNSGVIIMEDADLEPATSRILTGGYAVAGQVCISVQRIFVQENIHEQFLNRLVPLVEKLKTGDPLDEETDMGPMVSEQAAIRAQGWIKEAVDAGAKSLLQVKRKGALLSPIVLTDVTPQMKVFYKEAFAPLVCVIPFRELSEAIQLVNRSIYGLQAGIYTRRISDALKAVKELDVGGVMVNDIPTFRVDHMPYGGVKESGIGREGVKYAIEEMTEMKLVCFNL